MKTKLAPRRTVALSRRNRILAKIVATTTLLALLSPAPSALATQTTPGAVDPADYTYYPLLPDLPGADIRGEAGVVVLLSQDRVLVEVEDQLYELGGRPLEIGFDGPTQVTVLFELPDDAPPTLLITDSSGWTETVTAHLGTFDYTLSPGDPSVGVELATPSQAAPTRPDIILAPIEDEPEEK